VTEFEDKDELLLHNFSISCTFELTVEISYTIKVSVKFGKSDIHTKRVGYIFLYTVNYTIRKTFKHSGIKLSLFDTRVDSNVLLSHFECLIETKVKIFFSN
jgi:hypothetical protein